MFYLKLTFIVIFGSIGIWLGVEKLVHSTDHLKNRFTAESFQPDETADQRDNVLIVHKKQADSLSQVDFNAPVLEQTGEDIADVNPLDINGAEQELLPELEVVAAETPTVVVIINDEDETEGDDELQQGNEDKQNNANTDKNNNQSSSAETARADSDLDIQVNKSSNSEGGKTSRQTISQGKALALDKNFLDTIEPIGITTKTAKPNTKTVRALDLAVAVPDDSACVIPGNDAPRIGIRYRPDSYAIKGKSLSDIDKLITIYRNCGGKLLILDNKVSVGESRQHLIQLRQHEVKYYLLQSRVPKADIIFPKY